MEGTSPDRQPIYKLPILFRHRPLRFSIGPFTRPHPELFASAASALDSFLCTVKDVRRDVLAPPYLHKYILETLRCHELNIIPYPEIMVDWDRLLTRLETDPPPLAVVFYAGSPKTSKEAASILDSLRISTVELSVGMFIKSEEEASKSVSGGTSQVNTELAYINAWTPDLSINENFLSLGVEARGRRSNRIRNWRHYSFVRALKDAHIAFLRLLLTTWPISTAFVYFVQSTASGLSMALEWLMPLPYSGSEKGFLRSCRLTPNEVHVASEVLLAPGPITRHREYDFMKSLEVLFDGATATIVKFCNLSNERAGVVVDVLREWGISVIPLADVLEPLTPSNLDLSIMCMPPFQSLTVSELHYIERISRPLIKR